jgi:hypothetical protein
MGLTTCIRCEAPRQSPDVRQSQRSRRGNGAPTTPGTAPGACPEERNTKKATVARGFLKETGSPVDGNKSRRYFP